METAFSDGTFLDSDWTLNVIINEVGRSAEVDARNRSSGGNPRSFRQVTHQGEQGKEPREIHAAHLNREAIYEPQANGPIESITYSYDLINLEERESDSSNYHLLIFQDGTYYRTRSDRVSSREWTSFGSSGLIAGDFIRIAGSGQGRPDFRATAPPLQFGFLSVSRFSAGEPVPDPSDPDGALIPAEDRRMSGIDNWMVSLTPAVPALEIVTDSTLPGGTVGSPFNEMLSATGGTPPYSWFVGGGALPPGMSLNGATGAIQGTPTAPGEFLWIAIVTDLDDLNAVKAFRLEVGVGADRPQRLAVRPLRLLFSFVQGSAGSSQRLFVLNEGRGALNFQVEVSTESGGEWLTVSPVVSETTAVEPAALNVEVDPAGMLPGTYFANIRISSAAGSLTVPVVMAIGSRSRLLSLSQTGLRFTALEGNFVVPGQNIEILNGGAGVMAWDIDVTTLSGGDWLSVNPLTGASEPSSPGSVDVEVNSGALTPGAYYGLLEIAASDAAGSPQFTTVVLNLLAGNSAPGPLIEPLGLVFSDRPGDAPDPREVRIHNLTNRSIPFTLQPLTLNGVDWLAHTVDEGTIAPRSSFTVQVTVTNPGLAPGIYRGLLWFRFGDDLARTLDVLLAVAPGRIFGLKPAAPISQQGCTPSAVAPVFRLLGGTSPIPAGWPSSMEVEVVDDCGAAVEEGSVVADFAGITSPSVALGHAENGIWAATWNVPEVLQESMAAVTVTATDPGGVSGSLTQMVNVIPNPMPAPRVSSGGVVHGASFVQDPLGPGTIVSIFGQNLSGEPASGGQSAAGLPLPDNLAGTQISLGGRPLPILFSRTDQVNAVLPFGVSDRLNENLPLLVRRTDAQSLAVSEPVFVTLARPGLFAQNAAGTGPGVIQNVNFQVVTAGNPVQPGDVVIIYGTGLGEVAPGVVTGAAAPASPLAHTAEEATVTIGGIPAQVLFAGLTPSFASLYQVNAFVPQGVASGQVEVLVTIGGQTSPPVTLAIQ